MILEKRKRYIIRPTIPKLWVSNHWKADKIDYKFYDAELLSVLKTVFKFIIDGYIWKCPLYAVEIFGLINKNCINEYFIRHSAKKCMEKFSKHGFGKMTDDELRMIVAFLQLCGGSFPVDESYPMQIVSGIISTFKNRKSIIRILRSDYNFRNTMSNRRDCLSDWKEDFIN